MTSFVSLLLPMLVAARLRLRGGATDEGFDAMDELRQPPRRQRRHRRPS